MFKYGTWNYTTRQIEWSDGTIQSFADFWAEMES